MSRRRTTTATVLAILFAGCASAPQGQAPAPPGPPEAPEARAVLAAATPIVDGIADASEWADAPETEVPIGPPGVHPCRMKALVHRGTLFLLFRWNDATENKGPMKLSPRINSSLNGDNALRRPGAISTRREGDQLSVLLPMDGTPSVDPWEGIEGRWDWWEWTAAVSDRVGHAADMSWTISRTRWPGAPESMEFDGNRIWRLGAEDEGQSIFPRPPESLAEGPGNPTGSAADVLARGIWKDGEWTLELARAISTANVDDVDLSRASVVLMGVQVNSPLPYQPVTALRLLLPPPVPEDHQGPFPEPRGSPRE